MSSSSGLRNKKIVLIGGGTGSFTLLQELKHLTPGITALVNMSDDGGSTGKLRDELGVLPPGDVRQCLIALSNTPQMRELFNFRFGEGELAGHSMGNIILSGLELQYGDFAKAIEVTSQVLNITGRVAPITLDKHQLVLEDGKDTIRGEFKIAHHHFKTPDARIRLEPKASINPEARAAILCADLVVIAPGNLYGSLLPALTVEGTKEAITNTTAQVVMISNLVTKPGQTDDWHVADYVNKMEEYLGTDVIDIVLYNNKLPSAELLKKYAADGEFPVLAEKSRFNKISARPIGASLVAGEAATQDKNDTQIRRTLIRHDAIEVKHQLQKIILNLSQN